MILLLSTAGLNGLRWKATRGFALVFLILAALEAAANETVLNACGALACASK